MLLKICLCYRYLWCPWCAPGNRHHTLRSTNYGARPEIISLQSRKVSQRHWKALAMNIITWERRW